MRSQPGLRRTGRKWPGKAGLSCTGRASIPPDFACLLFCIRKSFYKSLSRRFSFPEYLSVLIFASAMFRSPIRWWLLPCIFAVGCGRPAYRLDGRVPDANVKVSLLDSAAVEVVDSLRLAYALALEGLQGRAEAALDSLHNGMASIEKPLAGAKARYRAALGRYRSAFEEMVRFKSFGGNPIFSDADLDVGTARLLNEVANRFYRGKSFSLQMEGEIRRFVRNRLVPLEREVARARTGAARMQASKAGTAEARKEMEAAYARRRVELRERVNREILDGLQARIVGSVDADSTGRYRFQRLMSGRYYLYVPQPLPEAWLLPVDLRGHIRQDLEAGNRRTLLFAEEG